jgi:hypothetical protein
MLALKQDIAENRRLILSRTVSRFTAQDFEKHRIEQERHDSGQDRQIEYLLRVIDSNQKKRAAE